MPISNPIDRFWKYVEKSENPDDCWIWLGGRDADGYGLFAIGHHRSIRAHRFSYRLHYGELPRGPFVLHTCDNPPCVNPAHLFLGSHQDNMDDAKRKGRYPVIHRGEQSNFAKLTLNQVQEIRSLAGMMKQVEIARRFNVCPATICLILNGQNWRNLQKSDPVTL